MMGAHNSLFALAVLFLLPFAQGAAASPPPSFSDDYPCVFDLATESSLPADAIIYVEYTGANGVNRSTAIVSRQGSAATLYADSPAIIASIVHEDYSTPSHDGVWSGAVRCDGKPQVVPIKPVGKISGIIYYQNGSVASGAEVWLSCSEGIARFEPASDAGGFSFADVPEGKCMLSSSSGGQDAKLELPVYRGDFRLVELPLAKPGIPLAAWIAIGAAGLLALGVAALVFAGRGKPPAAARASRGEKQPKPQPPDVPTRRQLDLLATLDEKERGIVEFVQHGAPSAVKVSKIRRELLIPKTSLTRTLSALERKQFLKIGKMGSRTYAQLHEFYKKAE